MTTTSSQKKQVHVSIRSKGEKAEHVFVLSLDQESISLDPATTWSHADRYKWVVRGLIEAPQMLHVFPDGSVEINSEKISIADPNAAAKLENQINKHHLPASAHPPVATGPTVKAATPAPDPRQFRVKLDHFGHLMIEWGHGPEREETSLRGLASLITNGLLRKPEHYRVDPMQRSIEIDGVIYQCNEEGAKKLETALNTRYAPRLEERKLAAIEIKENLAASTGFDIHFRTTHAGVTHDLKGHLTQELLDVLQDSSKSDLIQPGIHLLLSPPNLLIRRRRPDMGEEKIPELPDINLLRVTSVQLQQLFNHPMIRRHSGETINPPPPSVAHQAEEIVNMRVTRNETDSKLLWLECLNRRGETGGSKALTHRNVADLQNAGCFQPELEVCLSLDHRRLTIHDRRTNKAEAITFDSTDCSEAILLEASQMLTRALKHSAVAVTDGRSLSPTVFPSPATPSTTTMPAPPAKETDVRIRPAPASSPLASAITALFEEKDALRINQEVFRRLSEHLGIPVQDVCLSLPLVFDNRRFEILNFDRQEITSVLELRGTDFYGFYLSHVSDQKLMLVYACNGMHIEWGPDRCLLQATIKSEAEEYRGRVLLGIAQNRKNEFVFVVDPEFKKWIAPREMPYTDENLEFLTVADLAAAPDNYTFIWPQRPQ